MVPTKITWLETIFIIFLPSIVLIAICIRPLVLFLITEAIYDKFWKYDPLL